MTINLDEIEKALGEATQGKWLDPWETEIDEDFEGIKSETGEVVLSVQWHDGDRLYLSKPNAHLIANAPEWLRLLVEQSKKILARNEELQRRVDALTDAAKRCSYHVAARMHDLGDTELEDDYGPYKEVKADYMALLNALDAKEQDDA